MAQDKRRSAPPDSPFDPPYTTFNLGQIGGGKAINIVAQDCSFTWEYRPLPGEDAETILAAFEAYSRETVLPALREFAPDAAIETERLATVPPLSPRSEEHTSELQSLMRISYAVFCLKKTTITGKRTT